MRILPATLCTVLLFAAPLHAEPAAGWKGVMLGAFLAGGVADATSTCTALARGGREAVLTQSCRANTAIIGAEMAAGSVGLSKLYQTHPKLAVGIGIVAGAFRIGVAAHNAGVR